MNARPLDYRIMDAVIVVLGGAFVGGVFALLWIAGRR